MAADETLDELMAEFKANTKRLRALETDSELLREIAEDVRYLRFILAELEPLLPLLAALRGNGQVDAAAAAGIRRAIRKRRSLIGDDA